MTALASSEGGRETEREREESCRAEVTGFGHFCQSLLVGRESLGAAHAQGEGTTRHTFGGKTRTKQVSGSLES